MKVMYQFINVVGNLTNSDLGSVNNTIFISLKIIILLNSLNLLNYQIDFTSAPYLCSCHRCRWTVCPYRWWTWFPSVATPLSDCMHPTLPRYNIINNLKSNYWKLNSLFFLYSLCYPGEKVANFSNIEPCHCISSYVKWYFFLCCE